MLKIAEYNTITGEKIDLKELEKYGFEKDRMLGYILTKYENENWQKILVRVNNEKVINFNYGSSEDTIQHLIKDGLVEKVSDNNE